MSRTSCSLLCCRGRYGYGGEVVRKWRVFNRVRWPWPMPWWLRTFCWLVSQLNRLPRYGRLYRMMPREFGPDGRVMPRTIDKKPEWRYQSRGWWGLNILDNMGLLWPYLHHLNPDMDDYDEDGYLDNSDLIAAQSFDAHERAEEAEETERKAGERE